MTDDDRLSFIEGVAFVFDITPESDAHYVGVPLSPFVSRHVETLLGSTWSGASLRPIWLDCGIGLSRVLPWWPFEAKSRSRTRLDVAIRTYESCLLAPLWGITTCYSNV
jgi:hypothetical protein